MGLCVRARESYSLKNSAANASYRHVSICFFVLEARIVSVEPVNLLTSLTIIYPKQEVKVAEDVLCLYAFCCSVQCDADKLIHTGVNKVTFWTQTSC